jgi:nucleotide-binding universal stress UspA family protein
MRIVVGVDQSAHAERALRWAAGAARVRGAELRVVMAAGVPLVASPLGWPGSSVDSDLVLEDRRKALDAIVHRVVGTDPVTPAVVPGAAAEVLLAEARHADLLVVGTRELRGVFRWLGSVSDQVVRHAQCPVVVVPESAVAGPDDAPVLVGVDGSANSLAAVRWALDEARARRVPLRAVAVWALLDQARDEGAPFDPRYDEHSARDFVREVVEKAVGPEAAAEVELAAVCDLPARGLVEAADAAQTPLLVIGARGTGGFKGLLLGSVSQKVLATTTSPVAVIHDAVAGAPSDRLQR